MSEEKPKRTITYSSVEATLRGAEALENREILDIFKAEFGFDPLRPKKEFDWSITKVIERVVPEKLGWQGTDGEKLFRLGQATFLGWGDTILGRILTASVNRAEGSRAFELMARNMSLNPALGEHELKKLSPTSYIFTGTGDPRAPEFVAGMMTPVLDKVGISNYKWEARRTGFEAYEIAISWPE